MATPRSAPVGRPRTFDRGEVIEVAVESYWRDGVEGVSLNEICRRAGVSKPGVYREFGGEDGLMDAALAHYAEKVLAPNFDLVTNDLAFAEALDVLVEVMTDANRAGPAGCLLVKMQHAPARLGDATTARVEQLLGHARSSYAAWVDQAKERGEVSPKVSTTVAAALIDIQCTTLLVQMALGEDPELLRAQARMAFAGLAEPNGTESR